MFATFVRFCATAALTAGLYAVVAIAAASGIRAWQDDEPAPAWLLAIDVGALAIACLAAYPLYARWVYGVRVRAAGRLKRYLLVVAAGIALHEGLFQGVIALLPLSYPLVLAATLGAVGIATFVVLARWVFVG